MPLTVGSVLAVLGDGMCFMRYVERHWERRSCDILGSTAGETKGFVGSELIVWVGALASVGCGVLPCSRCSLVLAALGLLVLLCIAVIVCLYTN